MIALTCPGCQKKLSVKEELSGRKIKCPGCGNLVVVPQTAAATLASQVQTGEERTLPPRVAAKGEEATVPPKSKNQGGGDSLADSDEQTGPGPATQSLASPELTDFLAPAQQPDELGRLGPFRVLKVLGAGGMGVVYKAEDPQLKRLVALKAMLPTLGASESARKRFIREAQSAAAIVHDHIVPIHQVGEDRGIPFVAMQFLEGEPLDERLKREGCMDIGEILRIGRETAEGLAAAHDKGLIHRDIKPANIWLEGKKGRVKILDFGLARAAADDSHLTQTGAILGTPAYMAPEQAAGEKVDARCDLFSLGCVLYRLCTGQFPFKGKDSISTLIAVATENPDPPDEINPEVPVPLSDLVMTLLAKKPVERPPSAHVVAEALQNIDPKAVAMPDRTVPKAKAQKGKEGGKTQVEPGRKPGRKKRLPLSWLMAGGVLGLALVVAVIVIFWQSPHGLVRIESDDPNVEITFMKDGPVIKGAGKEPISIRSGEYSLLVKRGDFQFETDKLFIAKGKTVTLKVELLGDKIQVSADGRVLGTEGPPLAKTFTKSPIVGPAVLVPHPAQLQGVKGWTVVPRGHLRNVTLAAWAADSQRIASGGEDGTVRLWDPVKGALRLILLGHTGPVTALAWSPDAKTLASASDDLTVLLWDTDSGRLLNTLRGHTGAIRTLAWSADGKKLASGGDDQSLRLWEAESGAGTRTFKEHRNQVTAVAWRPDGKTLVSFSTGNNLYCLWEAGSGKIVHSHAGAGPSCWSPDYKVLALKTGKNTVAFWDADADQILRTLTLKEQQAEITGLAWSSDGKILGTGSGPARVVQLWDATTGKHLRTTTQEGHDQQSFNVRFSPDNRVVASDGANEHHLTLWSVDAGGLLHRLFGRPDLWHVSAPSFSPDSKTVSGIAGVQGNSCGSLWFWECTTGKNWSVQTYRADTRDVAWSPDGKFLATLSRYWNGEEQLRLWDVAAGQLRHRFHLPNVHTAPLHGVAWSPDSKTLATSFDLGTQLWDPSSGQPIRKLTGKHADRVHALAWSPKGNLLASFANDAWLWDPATGAAIRPLTGQKIGFVLVSAWSPDAKTLATGNNESADVHLWDIASGKHRSALPGHKAKVTALAWSPDGGILASGSDDMTVRLWDDKEKLLIDLKDPERQGQVTALTWLPDGKSLVTLSSNNMVCVWNAVSGELVRSTKASRGTGRFSPDGRLLASTNDIAGVRLWELETGRTRGTLLFLRPETPDQYVVVSGDGHYRGEPPRLIDKEVVYVVQTDRGQETLTPADFEKKYGWKNNPEKVRPAPTPVGKEMVKPPVEDKVHLDPQFKNGLGMEFVLVSKGKSWLGGGGGRPGHLVVEVKQDFYLGTYEVTQEEWEKVMLTTPSTFKGAEGVTKNDLKRFPVENVSLEEAKLFAAQLNARDKNADWVYRLPTEIEWEYACRGGPMTDPAESSFHYYVQKPANQILPTQANFSAKVLARVCKVGSYKPNKLGLFDMHGNVFEWCVNLDPKESQRVVRGGSHSSPGGAEGDEACQAASRNENLARARYGHVGFRVARVRAGKEPLAVVVAELKRPVPPAAFKNKLGMEFVVVPKGESWLGGASGAWGKKVEFVNEFYLGRYEVTQEQWQMVMDSKGQLTDEQKQLPAGNVSWDDAQVFLTKLNAMEKEAGWVYRLPKEVEWEYACRGGPLTVQESGHDFYFEKPAIKLHANLANTILSGFGKTRPVGSYQANRVGIFDMHGNVAEWCEDRIDGKNRALRGGGYNDNPVRVADREVYARMNRHPQWGLRVARVPVGKDLLAPQSAYKNDLGMEFVIIPKGKSWLGGGEGKPGTKEVEILHDFYLGTYEVTQQEWQKVMGKNPSIFRGTAKEDPRRFPVENVSWEDCQQFIIKLNEMVKEDGWTYRLPTEAEWEYACRGGPMTDKAESAFEYYLDTPTNKLLPSQANFDHGQKPRGPRKVGSYKPNRLGLYDMHGNVWEWCQEALKGDKEVLQRVIRGGSWGSFAAPCAVNGRIVHSPTNREDVLGLRLARVPVGKQIVKRGN